MARNNFFLALLLPLLAFDAQAAVSPFDEPAYLELQTSVIQKRAERDKAMHEAMQSLILPRVISIMVDARGAYAQVAYKSGLVRLVTAGDNLKDGVRVASITPFAVNASVNGSVVQLNFYTEDKDGDSGEVLVSNTPPNIRIPLPSTGALPPVPAPVQ